MKTNGRHKMLAKIARRGLVRAVLFAMVLSVAGVASAQTTATSAPEWAVKLTPQLQATQPLSAVSEERQAPPKGQKEGIKVHGHWTIDVKNPDGTVVSHRAFENALSAVEGSNLLTQLLAGSWVSGGFFIQLAQATVSGGCDNFGQCYLYDSRAGVPCPLYSTGASRGTCGSLTFTTNPSTSFPAYSAGYTLTGTIQPPQGIQISSVESGTIMCGPSGVPSAPTAFSTTTPSVCGSGSVGAISPNVTSQYWLTGTNIAPLTVSPGQSVAVSVTITFQ